MDPHILIPRDRSTIKGRPLATLHSTMHMQKEQDYAGFCSCERAS